MSKEFDFEVAGEALDVREIVDRSIALFAPELRERHEDVALYLAQWMRDGGPRRRWPDWTAGVQDWALDAVKVRAFAWAMAALRRRQITDPDILKVFKLVRIRPYFERCCESARMMADLHFAADDPPLVPLPGCTISPCLCWLETLTACDFDDSGASVIEIVSRTPTTNGAVAAFVVSKRS